MNLPPPPAELAQLTDIIGAEALWLLVEAHGGTRIYIPRLPAEGMPLVRLLGWKAALAMGEVWGGDYLRVPVAKAWRVRVLRSQGLSGAAIARKLTMSENTVNALLRAPASTRQMALPL